MKKTIFLLAALPLCAGSLFAQEEQIPDGQFAYWTENQAYNGDTYYELSNPFWQSLNMLATLPPEMFTAPVTMFRDGGRSGAAEDYAPKLVSNTMVFGEDGSNLFLPGVVGAISVIIDDQTAQFGRPFTSRPSAIKGYMKYEPVNGDSASIIVELSHYDPDFGRLVIGRVEQKYKEAVPGWTEFNLSIPYNSQQTPDSVTVLFVSSAGYDFDNLFACQGQVGSTLWVDDVEFVYGQASNGPAAELESSRIYPNPSATGQFNIQVPAACRAEVVSLSGAVVASASYPAEGTYALDLSRLPQGVYLVRLNNEDGAAVLKAVRR